MNKTTERLKSALYLRLKKRKVFKIVKGALDFLKIQFVAKYQKTEGGLFQGNFEKKSHSAGKNSKRGPFSLVRFRKCSKKFLANAGTRTRDRWVPRKPIKVCTKKWYMQGAVCGLTKKN